MYPFHNCRKSNRLYGAIAAALGVALAAPMSIRAEQPEANLVARPGTTAASAPTTLDDIAQRVRRIETLVVAVEQLERSGLTKQPTLIVDFATIAEELDALRDRAIMVKTKDASAVPSTLVANDTKSDSVVGCCPIMAQASPDDVELAIDRQSILLRIDRLANFVEPTERKRPADGDETLIAELWERIDRISDGLDKVEIEARQIEAHVVIMNTILDTYKSVAESGARIALDIDGLYNAFDVMKLDLGRLDEENQSYVDDAFKVYKATLAGGDFEQSFQARQIVGQADADQHRIRDALAKLESLFERIRKTEAEVVCVRSADHIAPRLRHNYATIGEIRRSKKRRTRR